MMLNRNYLFIAISSVALLTVLLIQVNWILESARIKEELFSEKANMVLSKTAEAIHSDAQTCGKIVDYVEAEPGSDSAARLGVAEVRILDSLFAHYMSFYNFHVDYSFVVTKPDPVDAVIANHFANYIYQKPLENATSQGRAELKLIFPDKNQFIMGEMGTLFITSVILIIVVLVMFWRTIQSLLKEKRLSDQTTDFLNNMTHEFKTPLTNIALAGKMLSKDQLNNQESRIKHYSGIILEENEKLRLQVEQMLSMTALERGEIPLQKAELDFHKLIHESVKCISVQIENKKGNIKLELMAERYLMSGDKTHLTNALCNLIDNAIKYSKEVPELFIQTFNAGEYLVVEVSDNGVGIDKEYHKKVFEKYFRIPTGDIHNVKGFGLGLAYTKKIVELHGGTIEPESENGNGTTFTIKFPNV